MSQLLRRKIYEVTLTPGKLETIPLPRNYMIRGIVLRVAGYVTISGGSSSGTPKTLTPLQFLGTLEVRREGKDTLFRMPAEMAGRMNTFQYGTPPNVSGLSTGDAQTNTAVNGEVYIPFETFRGISKLDTGLKARGLSSLDLLVNVGQASDLVSGGDRTIAVGSSGSFTLIVETVEELGLDDFISGDMRQYVVASVGVSASSDSFQIKPLPVGNEYYGFFLRSRIADLDVSTMINRIKLKSGSEVFYDVDANALRESMKRHFGLETAPAGYYPLPLSLDGLLNSSLDTRNGTGRDTLEFELKVTYSSGTHVIDVVSFEYIRPQVALKK